MFQVIGVTNGGERVVIGTAAKPGDALKCFRASQNRYSQVFVLSPDGAEITGFELGRLYEREQRRIGQ